MKKLCGLLINISDSCLCEFLTCAFQMQALKNILFILHTKRSFFFKQIPFWQTIHLPMVYVFCTSCRKKKYRHICHYYVYNLHIHNVNIYAWWKLDICEALLLSLATPFPPIFTQGSRASDLYLWSSEGFLPKPSTNYDITNSSFNRLHDRHSVWSS